MKKPFNAIRSKFIVFGVYVLIFALISACADLYSAKDSGKSGYPNSSPPYGDLWDPENSDNTDEFEEIKENDFISAADEPNSYFSLNVNTASYSIIRRNINNNAAIYKDQVLIEEMLNYFKFNYPVPDDGEILSINGWLTPCPWNTDAHLLTVGIKTEEVDMSDIRNNLVFLIDVSGSMSGWDRLGLVQEAFILLAENLNPNDRVSIVTYASGVSTALDGAMGYETKRIIDVIEDISAGGSTAGADGIQRAYTIAQKYFLQDGNNRVILATDGDFNVGISSDKELENFISQKRATGIYLSILGVGMGNHKNSKMEKLANAGNGNFAYLDSVNEARKVLIEEAGGTLKTVANDAKAMVSFDPVYVDKYRQIGYENRRLTQEDWENSDKDAGDLGAGRCITAVYEVILKNASAAGPFAAAAVRFKVPETNTDREISTNVSSVTSVPGADVKFISALVESALIMRDSKYKGAANMNAVVSRLEALDLANDEYKTEFLALMKKYRGQVSKQ